MPKHEKRRKPGPHAFSAAELGLPLTWPMAAVFRADWFDMEKKHRVVAERIATAGLKGAREAVWRETPDAWRSQVAHGCAILMSGKYIGDVNNMERLRRRVVADVPADLVDAVIKCALQSRGK